MSLHSRKKAAAAAVTPDARCEWPVSFARGLPNKHNLSGTETTISPGWKARAAKRPKPQPSTSLKRTSTPSKPCAPPALSHVNNGSIGPLAAGRATTKGLLQEPVAAGASARQLV
uniref:Uncharacterized protein n=1 Tax=Pyrodinium bahamense TaxID=73915 RepID=A0A7S0ARZ4_9DINO